MISRIALAAGVLALVSMPVAGLAYRAGIFGLSTAFMGLRWAAYLGIAAMVLALIGAIASLRRPVRRDFVVACVGFALGLAAFAIPYQWQRTARSVPPIHDITTDVVDPPAFVAVVALRADAPNALDYSAAVGQQQSAAYPDIVPMILPLRMGEAFRRALEVARDAGWEIVAADEQAGRIEATDTTFWFGFKDDVVIRLTAEAARTRVDVRSVSRVGRSDVGANAKRIRGYLRALHPD